MGVIRMISVKDISGLASHLASSNPHGITANTVGLGNVRNYPIATTEQANLGTSNSAYMTPALVAYMIDEISKGDIGLGLVTNAGFASKDEAIDARRGNLYMSPLNTFEALKALHLELENPHGITPEIIGLGNLRNYPIATESEARLGWSAVRYMTPQRTMQLVDKYMEDFQPAEVGEGEWTLARQGTEAGTLTVPVDLSGKEVCFVSTDVSDIDEISVTKGFIPERSGFASDCRCYLSAGNTHIEYIYSTRQLITTGDKGNRQIWYRTPANNAYPNMGVLTPSSNTGGTGSTGGGTGGGTGGSDTIDDQSNK